MKQDNWDGSTQNFHQNFHSIYPVNLWVRFVSVDHKSLPKERRIDKRSFDGALDDGLVDVANLEPSTMA
jgi:hypothetical protein